MQLRILVIILLLPLMLQSTAALADKLKPCHVPDVEEEVLCGHYDVYENRTAGAGRKIALNIVVLPAKASDRADDPLVFLAGGGVAPATSYAG
jgi:hypothetical protein